MDQSETRDKALGLREARGCFQTPASSGIPSDASRRQSRAGVPSQHGASAPTAAARLLSIRAGLASARTLSKYREAAQPLGGFPGTQTGEPACVIRGGAWRGDICYKTFRHRQRGLTSQSVLPAQGPFPGRGREAGSQTTWYEDSCPLLALRTWAARPLCASTSSPVKRGEGMINHLGHGED